MDKCNRIFLIGESGAGKGILAEAVAEKLKWTSVNMDYALEPGIGRNMTEILGEQGKECFLNTLTEMLKYQTTKEKIIVVTDDAIIFQEESRKILADEFTVFIDVSLNIQYERLKNSRPYLPVDDYTAYLENLTAKRDGLYKQVASFSLGSDDGDVDKHVEMIVDAFQKAYTS